MNFPQAFNEERESGKRIKGLVTGVRRASQSPERAVSRKS